MASIIKRRRLASALRQLREQAGLTLEDVASRLDMAQSTMSRIETARARARPVIVHSLLPIYGIHGIEADVIVQLARDASQRDWWYAYRDVMADWFRTFVGLEGEAAKIQVFQPQVVPSLLQTEEYARALLGAAWVNRKPAEVERRVQLRLRRQEVLGNRPGLQCQLVLGEAALHCRIGTPEILAAQLDRLVQLIDDGRIMIQVLPFTAGATGGELGQFVLLDFPYPEDPPVGYVEHLVGGQLVEEPTEVDRLRAVFRHQRTIALSPEESRKLIVEVATAAT
ncbi:helix-turn-helix transcriptional regulator [Micromonospora polyrhachis]|uniref:Transcriptional regulator with XRE-family HTH domain n=1 Tax=Micromonospora polyrhachis TaxID=1282883 RepID=A0A7W7WQT2_9ACTN|nr:helix-turn-helix transcriptional regulator [Micromonospora polyrhachis]MBB4960586.1 transcriptional regulator with XRE-family HTH domain [Micromonospora polyrhachis]